MVLIGIIIMIFAIISIEGQLRKAYKQNEEIIELLKEIKEKQ
ncbi:hypothetical protein [Halalkalibacter sp. APA_J-10(15)]|nr:hypothetical protein [Halalkalibacter sp. APA_J-10(15)]